MISACEREWMSRTWCTPEELHQVLRAAAERRRSRASETRVATGAIRTGDYVLVARLLREVPTSVTTWTGSRRVVVHGYLVHKVEGAMWGQGVQVHAARMRLYSDASLTVKGQIEGGGHPFPCGL